MFSHIPRDLSTIKINIEKFNSYDVYFHTPIHELTMKINIYTEFAIGIQSQNSEFCNHDYLQNLVYRNFYSQNQRQLVILNNYSDNHF